MNYSEEIQQFYQRLGSTPWNIPGFPGFEKTYTFELPHIGPQYSAGGVMFLQSDPRSLSPLSLLTSGINKDSQTAKGKLEFLFVTCLAGIFLERYGAEKPSTGRVNSLEFDFSDSAVMSEYVSSLDQIAFGRISQVHPRALSDEQRKAFLERWLTSALKGQIEILRPFYFVVFGKSAAAWEIVSQACGATAWRRETGATSIGHIIAIHERELIHEVIFIERQPTNAEELKELLTEFRRFIEGGFLLGREPFSFVTR